MLHSLFAESSENQHRPDNSTARRGGGISVAVHLIAIALIAIALHHRAAWVAPYKLPGSPHGSNFVVAYLPDRAPQQSAAAKKAELKPKDSPLTPALAKRVARAAAPATSNTQASPNPNATTGADALGSGNITIALTSFFPPPHPDLSPLPPGTRGQCDPHGHDWNRRQNLGPEAAKRSRPRRGRGGNCHRRTVDLSSGAAGRPPGSKPAGASLPLRSRVKPSPLNKRRGRLTARGCGDTRDSRVLAAALPHAPAARLHRDIDRGIAQVHAVIGAVVERITMFARWLAISFVNSASAPGLSSRWMRSRISRPSCTRPRSIMRESSVTSMLPPQTRTAVFSPFNEVLCCR